MARHYVLSPKRKAGRIARGDGETGQRLVAHGKEYCGNAAMRKRDVALRLTKGLTSGNDVAS